MIVHTSATGESGLKRPLALHLRPAGRQDSAPWILRVANDLLTLENAEGVSVLTVHRDEAARYIRVRNDLFRGRTLTLAVAGSRKTHVLACSADQVERLLAHLPRKSDVRLKREIRFSGIGVGLFGVLHLLLPGMLFWPCAALLLAVGVAAALAPRRTMYAVNGAALVFAGLWDLVTQSGGGLNPWALSGERRVVPIAVGSLLLLWGIHQLSMLGAAQQLRAARAVRDRRAEFQPAKASIVKGTTLASALVGVLCLLYAGGIAWWIGQGLNGPGLVSAENPLLADFATYGILSLLALAFAVYFATRRLSRYTEAKVVGQFLVALAVFSLWGMAFGLWSIGTGGAYAGMLSPAAGVITSPLVWVSLVGAVWQFNRWFGRIQDRELESLRD